MSNNLLGVFAVYLKRIFEDYLELLELYLLRVMYV